MAHSHVSLELLGIWEDHIIGQREQSTLML